MIIAVSTAIPLLLAGLGLLWLAYRASRKTLPMSFLVGIRTMATLSSEDAWRRGHHAAARSFSVGGLGLMASSVAALFIGNEDAIYASMAGGLWAVGWLFVASFVANKAIKGMPGESPQA